MAGCVVVNVLAEAARSLAETGEWQGVRVDRVSVPVAAGVSVKVWKAVP